MLSIGVLLPGRAEYYLGTVANGVEDYYTGAGEAPGQWCGTSAARLGLVGEVEADALHRVLEHARPGDGGAVDDGSCGGEGDRVRHHVLSTEVGVVVVRTR